MRSALYFPHTEVRSKDLIRSALLTWDHLEYIAPFEGYHTRYEDRDSARAMEIIGRARVASSDDQRNVHSLVEELLQKEVPETFKYSPSDGNRTPEYEMWPQKLAGETWELLRANGLTDRPMSNMDYPTSQAAGLSLMAIIADVLAGETRSRVTDQGLAYATIANVSKVAELPNDDYAQIVPITLKVASLDKVPMSRLIALREREEKSADGADYRALRHNYLAAIEKHVERVSKLSWQSSDRAELDRVFASDMESDFQDLKTELGFAKREALFTKEAFTLVLAAGAAAAAAVIGAPILVPGAIAGSGGLVSLGGFLGTANKFGKARRDLMRKHSMAYLYEVT